MAIPAIGLCMLNVYLAHNAHHGHAREEFVPYEHMRLRAKVGKSKCEAKIEGINILF